MMEKINIKLKSEMLLCRNKLIISCACKHWKNAYVGAGSTITKDIPDNALGVGRGKQKIKKIGQRIKINMCGIIGAASSRSVGKILIKGLQLMEYRGYDSAGVVLNKDEEILRFRSLGKVSKLEEIMISKSQKLFWYSSH